MAASLLQSGVKIETFIYEYYSTIVSMGAGGRTLYYYQIIFKIYHLFFPRRFLRKPVWV